MVLEFIGCYEICILLLKTFQKAESAAAALLYYRLCPTHGLKGDCVSSLMDYI